MQKKQKKENIDTSFWNDRRGKIFTKKGGLVIGEDVYTHGYSLFDDLFGKASYFQVLILHATGRMPERRLADWMEAYYLCGSYPDARIWCNQIGSLAGAMRSSPLAASSAGILSSDSRMYGPGTGNKCVEFITRALSSRKLHNMSPEEIIDSVPRKNPDSAPVISGFSRPVARGDERVPAIEKVTRELGFETGEHLALAYELEKIMMQKYEECMNIVGYRCAFLSDQGYSSQEMYRINSTIVTTGVIACYAEAMDNPPESFFPLRCDDINYQGVAARPLP